MTHESTDSFSTESIGGLNTRFESYTFRFNNTPRQLENLTAAQRYDNTIYLTWDTYPGTNHTLLYLDGAYNTSTTNTSYNFTNLVSGETYQFTAYAANGTAVNWTVTGENNISAQTTYNTSVYIEVYDEITLSLIPNSTITFIGPENRTVNDADGNFTFADLTPGAYTMRHTASGYGVRDQYITVANASTYNTQLYLLGTGNSTLLPRKIIDYQGRTVEGAVINLQRYFNNYSAYVTVESTTSGDNGLFNVYYQPFDAWYKFQILYNGVIVKTTTAQRWSTADAATAESISIDVSPDYLASVIPGLQMSANNPITYNKPTRCFSWTYNDAAGIVEEVCLTVYEMTLGRIRTEVDETCSAASSATLVACHDATNNSVVAEVTLDSNTAYSNHLVAWLEIFSDAGRAYSQSWGAYAVFIGILLIVMLSLLSGADPAYPVIFGTLGLIITAIITFVPVSFGVVAAITIAAIGLVGLYAWRQGK
jgi:hypothetical protein